MQRRVLRTWLQPESQTQVTTAKSLATLTLVHYIPRNGERQDLILELTEEFVESNFSLKRLVVDVLTHPLTNQLPPDQGWSRLALYPPGFGIRGYWMSRKGMQVNSAGETGFTEERTDHASNAQRSHGMADNLVVSGRP